MEITSLTAGETIKIGKYELSNFHGGGIWIQCDGGEGMQISSEAGGILLLEEMIDDFWSEYF